MIKAKYAMKHDYITTTKQGYCFFEMIPYLKSKESDKKLHFNFNERESFLIHHRQINKFLNIDFQDPESIKRKFFYEDEDCYKELIIKYIEDNKFDLIYKKENKKDNGVIFDKCELTTGDLFLLKTSFEYCYPYIIGWHAFNSKEVIKQDLFWQ